jgi:hypothetical protein
MMFQIYVSEASVLEEQLYHHTVQGSGSNSCLTMADVEAVGFGQQLSTAATSSFHPSVLSHSFVAWNPMSNSVVNIAEELDHDRQVNNFLCLT